MGKYTGLLFIGMLILQSGLCTSTRIPKIAIIGGGIGGASSSFFLNELFGGKLRIDLFEARKVGGRLATVDVAGGEYEAGGAIIHDRNLLMKRFVKLLGLEERPSCGDQKFGIWNKEEFVFEESSWEVVTLAKLIYRYNLQPFRLQRYVNSVLDDFEKIYKFHDDGIAFANVTALLSALGNKLPKMMEVSTNDHFTDLGYSSQVIDELVKATLVVNYGQSTDVQSFVGCVSLAGAGASLWSVKGGNKDVPKHLIYRNSQVNVVSSVVKKIVYLTNIDDGSRYRVDYTNKGSTDTMESFYDIVIVATPLTKDHEMLIAFENFPEGASFEFPGEYQSTFATFVQGDLNPKYFDLEDPIAAVLSCDPNKTIISSLGNLVSVEGSCSNVWKIFSRNPLEQRVIDDMFKNIGQVERIKWKAYPKYTSAKPRLDFKLHDSLYHINAIEWAASAMEMSALGGRNVAILAHNEYKQRHSVNGSLSKAKKSEHEKSSRFTDL